MYNAVICRYHEIAIKGNNRSMFEKQMIENLYWLLRDLENLRISRVRGRIWINHKDKSEFLPDELETIKQQLPKAFGLESFSPVIMCEPDIEALKHVVDNTAGDFFDKALAAQKRVSFRVRAKRSDKDFPLCSKDIEIALAQVIGRKYDHDRLDIDLVNGEITIGCEVRCEFAFIFYESYRAPGGLPVGCNSPVLALLSGGIDSPVACYMTMKRGCRVDFITFHSSPYTPPETVEKIKRVTAILNSYQRPGTLHICNLAPMQKAIRDNCDSRMRTVLYRRMMFRIAEKVARRNGRQALLTGEAVGQVASQTIINMSTINAATEMLVLRPLVGMDKNEAISIARHIGTFETCSEQVPDSCTVFAPKSPSTRVPKKNAEHEEARLGDFDALLEQIADAIESIRIEP